MTVFKIFLFIFLHFIVTFAKISDKRLCYNKDCSEPVSLAKTLLRYTSDDSRILSFPPNHQIKIFSKSAGSRTDLWGAEIDGKRGYVPISHVRESRIFHNDLKFLVATEGEDDPTISSAPKTVTETIPADKPEEKVTEQSKPVQNEFFPNTVTPTYEIIDGTTLYPDFSSTPNSIDVDNIQQITEHVTEATLPVKLDTKTVVENLNSETKPIAENTEQKEIEEKSEGNLNSNSGIKSSAETTQQKENKNKSDENLNPGIKSSAENTDEKKSDGNLNVNPEINSSAENTESKENEEKNDETIIDLSEEKNANKLDVQNSGENIDLAKQELKEEKIIENSNVGFENKSAEILNNEKDEEESEDDNDDEDYNGDDEEEEDEEEGEEVLEKPVNNDFPNVQDQIIVSQSENVDNKSTEIVNEVPKDNSKSINSEHLNNKVDEVLTSVNSSFVETSYESVNENVETSDMVQLNTSANELNNTFENNSAKAEESAEKIEQKVEPGVPSIFSNPLNLFSSHEVQDVEQKVVETNTQVPEFSTREYDDSSAVPASSESVESNVQFTVTTQTPIDQEAPLPFESLKETFTDNPNILPEFIDVQQRDSSMKQSELLKDINSDFSFENEDIELRKQYDSLEYSSQNNIGIGSVEEMTVSSAIDQSSENAQSIENIQNSSENASDESGFFSNMFSNIFGSKPEQEENTNTVSSAGINENIDAVQREEMGSSWATHVEENPSEKYLMSEQSDMQSCKAGKDSSCPLVQNQNQNYIRSENGDIDWSYEIPGNAYTILLYLVLTAVTVLLFSLGYYYIEKRRKDGKLIASINELEKKLLVTTKECHLAQNELKTTKEQLESLESTSCGSNVELENLKEELDAVKSTKLELEEQIANLESELENATETGMEMSQMLNELLTSQSGSEHLMKTINGLQKQLNDQKVTLNHTQSKLAEKTTENELLRTELQVTNEKVSHLQTELDKMVVNILSVQEEKSKVESDYEAQIEKLTTDHNSISGQLNKELGSLKEQINKYNSLIEETKRELDLKSNEYDLLKQSMKDIEGVQCNKESMKALLDVSHVKAEVLQLREEKHKLAEKLQKEIEVKLLNEKEVQVMLQEVKILKDKFEEAEKEKVEAETRLEVLSSYFKEREAQYQKEINENESKWMQKEGEATSTIERIKWIQEELQNYKSQNELLKKEILDQEVSLKSQISMLEKKNHENWLLTRQAERKLEESKQEASQLRNRLTIVEKNLNNSSQMNDDSMIQNHSNGDVAVSPLHMTNPENPGSPPLLFPHRDHMTTSPPLQVLPPFMPPPPHGVHFMPPPPPLTGVPPFMPPPPALFPGDHRPPPLGRMSSPPLHGRYSPDSRAYSPYDRDRDRDHDDSPPLSPTYTDDYRRRTPPPNVNHLPPRNYSPYSGKPRYWDDKIPEYRGQHHRNKSRPHKGLSSGSGNSDESLENSGRHSGRV